MAMLLLLAALGAVTNAEHPATKIVNLLQKLQVQVKTEGEAETAAYAKFQYWCSDLTAAKTKAIAEANDKISKSETSIEALTEDIAALESDIAHIAKELTEDEAGKAEAASQRGTSNDEFLQAKSDLEGTIVAIQEALESLEGSKPALTAVESTKQRAVIEKALAFVDIYAPAAAASKVHAFLQRQPMDADASMDRAAGKERQYDFKSGGVIEILKQLSLKFEDQLEEANQAETAANSAWKLADGAAQDELDAATVSKGKKETLTGDKGSQKSQAESDLTEATEARNGATAVLDDTKATCRMRASEFEDRSSRRAGEIEAMGKAIEVLGEVVHVRTPESKRVFLQSFLQMQKSNDPRARIVNLLRKAGKKDLAKLADAIARTEEQPLGNETFDQIKNMIQKMIFHLKSEQTDEDNHKAWCDTETAKTNKMLDDKEDTKAALTAAINSLTEEIAQLGRDIAANQGDVARLESDIESNTATRNDEKAENAATVKDATDAQAAIANAIAVLTDFYKSTGAVDKEAWEFVQLREVRAHRGDGGEDAPEPELWSKESPEYESTGGGPNVVGMLENIATDFASMEAQARADETTQQDSHDEWLTATQINISELSKDTDMKSARQETQKSKLEGKQADFSHNSKELDATNQYMSDLGPACRGKEGDVTYEDRKAARTKEIDALTEAQGILHNAFAAPEETGK